MQSHHLVNSDGSADESFQGPEQDDGRSEHWNFGICGGMSHGTRSVPGHRCVVGEMSCVHV